MNGYYFDYGEDIKDILKSFASDDDVDVSRAIEQCRAIAKPIEEIEDDEIRAEVERLQERIK